jgi:hypothetical protein
MSEHQTSLKLSGTVTHIFAHRFVVQTDTGPVLGDLTPRGREKITLRVGDRVELEGEMKPSELKVRRLSQNGGKVVEFEPEKGKEHFPKAESGIALRSAEMAGFETLGAPRRKPKHFEVLARRDGRLSELHIELDGHIRKVRSDVDQHKWAEAMRGL